MEITPQKVVYYSKLVQQLFDTGISQEDPGSLKNASKFMQSSWSCVPSFKMATVWEYHDHRHLSHRFMRFFHDLA